MGFDSREFVAEDLWLLIAILTVALVSLAGVAGLGTVAGVLSIVGFVLLVPLFLFWGTEIASVLFDERRSPTSHDSGDEALERLKRRYAEGAIDDEEFERRLDRLVATDAVSGEPDLGLARDDVESPMRTGSDGDAGGESARTDDTDTERDREVDRS